MTYNENQARCKRLLATWYAAIRRCGKKQEENLSCKPHSVEKFVPKFGAENSPVTRSKTIPSPFVKVWLRAGRNADLFDDVLAVQFLIFSQQNESGEHVRRYNIQVPEELREQFGDLRKRVLHKRIKILVYSRTFHG